ncbi:SpoIID/LytB domain-containing protein [Candidatus Nitrospira bockiana]
MSRLVVAVTLCLFWTPSVWAQDSIRVLLAEGVSRLGLQADRGLIVRFANGDERFIKGAATISTGPTGTVVNGIRMRSQTLAFRGYRGDVTVRIGVGPRTGSGAKGRSSAAASEPPGPSMAVPGVLILIRRPAGLLVVNELDVEEYVKGVVPAEMNAAWHPEALKVQAVAARTYALYQRMMNGGREYDLVAGTQDQVYRGRQGVDERVQQAVEATRGLILTHDNAPILAAFSSTAAGPTEDAFYVWSKDLPYLKGVDCPFDMNSPYYQWRVELPVHELERSFRKQGIPIGTIVSLTPYLYSPAGRVDKIRILHSQGELILRGQDFRKAVGYSLVPSTQFEVEALGRHLVLSGRGSGHGVGLCQWGAKELAEQGYGFETILRYYFPGTDLRPAATVAARPPSR